MRDSAGTAALPGRGKSLILCHSITCKRQSWGLVPGGAGGFNSPAPHGCAERECRGRTRLVPAWGGERVILGRSGSQGRAPLGTALISEPFSNQGRAAIPAEERCRLRTQVLCNPVTAATGFSSDSGGQSHPPSCALQGGSSPALRRGLALAHHGVPAAVSLCTARSPGAVGCPCQRHTSSRPLRNICLQ